MTICMDTHSQSVQITILTTVELDATGHGWVAQLSNYNFSIHYKTGKTNVDASMLSGLPSIQKDVVQSVYEVKTTQVILTLSASTKSSEPLE